MIQGVRVSQPLRRVFALGMALILFFHVSAPFAASSAPSPSIAVTIRGSQNLVPMVQQVAERYMMERPDVHIVVSAGGTYRGYKSLLDGTADIALASSPQSEEALNLRSPDSPRLVVTTVGQVAMVPIVHPGSPLKDLTTSQLRGIFSGRIYNLKQLGGKDLPIRVLIGAPSDGLTESWRTILIGDTDHFTPRAVILGVKERLERVAADPAAITFVSGGDLTERVKALTVNGVSADEKNFGLGRYEFLAPLMFVTTEDTRLTAMEFVSYFLRVNKDLRFPGYIASRTVLLPTTAKP